MFIVFECFTSLSFSIDTMCMCTFQGCLFLSYEQLIYRLSQSVPCHVVLSGRVCCASAGNLCALRVRVVTRLRTMRGKNGRHASFVIRFVTQTFLLVHTLDTFQLIVQFWRKKKRLTNQLVGCHHICLLDTVFSCYVTRHLVYGEYQWREV